MLLLGFDLGSSSIKVSVYDAEEDVTLATVQCPEVEMDISAPQPGWAEQDPEEWWNNLCRACSKLFSGGPYDASDVKAIGIAYQMHGLVMVNESLDVLRPSIIWCDSRAVNIGEEAFRQIGEKTCLEHFLNSPGNFTASKIKWVRDNQPEIYDKTHKILLPGDYIAMKLTGATTTTIGGLSEGILWDFKQNGVAAPVLDYYGIDHRIIPEVLPNFSIQGELTQESAQQISLKAGIPVTYRAGDQPNNALSLNVLEPGEVAATGGTSGVVYGVVDTLLFDPESRVNSFAHVNHSMEDPRVGILLCINGAGIQYKWLRNEMAKEGTSYEEMERIVSSIPINSNGLQIYPFGNGAERLLGNKDVGSRIQQLNFNRHHSGHFFRAALEGIAFSFAYGIEVLKQIGLKVDVIRVGDDNLFQSPVFSKTMASTLGCRIEVFEATGAVGAAKAAGVGVGFYGDVSKAVQQQAPIETYESEADRPYTQAYETWLVGLQKILEEQ